MSIPFNIKNPILNTDSYKPSHWLQYPDGTEFIESYIEPRVGNEIMYFGLQMFLKDYLCKQFTAEDIEEAAWVLTNHGTPFNEAGWKSMLKKTGGYMPVRIDSIPEGSVHPSRVMQVRVQNTDPEFFWLTNYLETALLRAVWYPSSVATVSFSIRKLIKKYMEETADSLDGLPFKLHDFGARGVSSFESAGIGGLSHLATGAMGTDTLTAIQYARGFYNVRSMPAFSIPAAEHSTITIWGRNAERQAYENMLKQYAREGKIVAVVSDSYDIFNAVENIWGDQLRQQVIDSKAVLVIRPDSGHPATIVRKVAQLIDLKFGHTMTNKGYRLLNNCRIIQGDGIEFNSVEEILGGLKMDQYSADNCAFGMGGALLQKPNRDTNGYAMKACAAQVKGDWRDVFKDPVTDAGKKSKRGRQETLVHPYGCDFVTVPAGTNRGGYLDAMRTVYENGQLLVDEDLDTIRARAMRFM